MYDQMKRMRTTCEHYLNVPRQIWMDLDVDEFQSIIFKCPAWGPDPLQALKSEQRQR